ncbi:MAG: class I SAM-dependent methyltransferase [Alphaproteobacteria bacterium]|jgi:SAM-dependent methyltransferase
MNENKNLLDSISVDDRLFIRLDDTPEELFYHTPRLVIQIDDAARDALAAHYATRLQEGDRILDLMSSCISHLPPDLTTGTVIGHGMNAEELSANPQLDDYFIQNLNKNPELPLEDESFDACLIAVSVQYLTDPIRVFSQIGRVLRPGGHLIVSFSNRMFPTKAVAIWRSLDAVGHQNYVAACMNKSAEFSAIEFAELSPLSGCGDPLFSVTGRTPV